MTLALRRLSTADPGFHEALDAMLYWDVGEDAAVNRVAGEIIRDIRLRGDAALLEYTGRFDRWEPVDARALALSADDFQSAYVGLDGEQRRALEAAAERIDAYHQHQRAADWEFTDAEGNRLGQKITPLDRVGLYVPGGQAAYPSTVLMTAIPARVAGVGEVVMTVPTPDGVRNPLVLAAAHVAGIDSGFAVGGAQAVAALAFGTASLPKVDKIVGPGGGYVAAAKRLVFGSVGIDIIAGPSEVLIITDGTAPEEPEQPRAAVIRASLEGRGALVQTRDLDEAVALANRIAPEHLELAVEDPDALLGGIRHAGAIFVGPYTPEVMGDYAAGPSHVLPTFGTARFSSPLGVYDFQKRSSVVRLSPDGAEEIARVSMVLARGEGLEAHALAAEARISGLDHNH